MQERAFYTVRLLYFFTRFVSLELFRQKESRNVVLLVLGLLFMILPFIAGSAVNYTKVFFSSAQKSTPPNLTKQELFSFIPGWTPSRYGLVQLAGVSTISFFDVPVLEDGTLYTDTPAYETLKGDAAATLFRRAHQNNTKVLLTLTQATDNTMESLFSDSAAQRELINGIVSEIQTGGLDGVTFDFESSSPLSDTDIARYGKFLGIFRKKLKQQLPNSFVAVAVKDSDVSSKNIAPLSNNTDKVFLMAYGFAVPEVQNGRLVAPSFGYRKGQYWNTVSTSVEKALASVPANKLSLETAWYGNSQNYPFYESEDKGTSNQSEPSQNTLATPLDNDTVANLIDDVPPLARRAARKNLPLLAKALENEGILNANVLAYALATVEHETAETFEPVEEIKGRKSSRRLGYEGGTDFFGRGFIQLTHIRNYRRMGERIGMGEELVKRPELAGKPDVSAKILAAFFKDNGIAALATDGNFIAARTPINPDAQGYYIAILANTYQRGIYQ